MGILLLGAAATFVPAAHYLSKQPARFRSSATILLEARDPRVPVFQEFSPFRPVPIQLEILRSRSLAESVIESLPNSAVEELLENPYEISSLQRLQNAYARLMGIEPRVDSPQRRALGALQGGRVTFVTRGDNGIVVVSAEATRPQVAVDIVNAYIEALLARTRSFNIDDARVSREFLEQQLSEVKKSLQASEEALRGFNASHGGIRIPEQNQATVERLSEAESALAEVAANRKMLEARIQAVREKLETQKRLLPPPAPSPAPPTQPVARSGPPEGIQRLRNQLAQLETTLLDMRTKYTDEHPRIVLVKDRIAEVQRQLGDVIKESTSLIPAPGAVPPRERITFAEQVVLLETSFHSMSAQEEALRKQVDSLRQNLGGLSRSELQYSRLVRDADSNRNLQTLLADRLIGARIREQGEMRNVKVIDPAGFPVGIPNDKRLRFLILALVAVVGVAVGTPALVEWIQRTVETEDDAEAATGLPVLTALPRVRSRRPIYGGAFTGDGKQVPGESFMFTEAVRGLRVAIQLAARSEGLRTILVASGFENEGKSTLVFNLGLAFREVGKRVGLADTDFERPTLHFASKMEPSEGLVDAMHGSRDLQASLAPLGDGMWLAPRGPNVKAHTRGMMATDRLKEIITELGEHADIVLCDSSPVLLVPESLFLAAAVDGVILLAKAGSTRARDLARTKAALEAVGARLLGVVVNEVPPSSIRNYYRRYYNAYLKRSEAS